MLVWKFTRPRSVDIKIGYLVIGHVGVEKQADHNSHSVQTGLYLTKSLEHTNPKTN